MNDLDNTAAIIREFEPLIEKLSIHELAVVNRMVVERMRLIQKAGALFSMSKFSIGERVAWDGSDGLVHAGVIIRMNRKTISVKTGEKQYWNVSPQLLRKDNGQ